MDILFTGFEPFGGEKINPSWKAVAMLPDEIAGARIHKLCLPVEYQGAARMAQAEFARISPNVVVMVGQAGGRSGISIERVALNLDDATVADNAGVMLCDSPVRQGAPSAYFSTLPIKMLVKAVNNAGVNASISNSAGTYVCNHLMYSMLDHISVRMLDVRAGFVHVPFVPEQCVDKPGMPSMELNDIVTALRVIARNLAD